MPMRTRSEGEEVAAGCLEPPTEEAAVGRHDETRQSAGPFTMGEERLTLPLQARVLGLQVTAAAAGQSQGRGATATCGGQRIALLDPPQPAAVPKGADWIAAPRHRARHHRPRAVGASAGAVVSRDHDQREATT